MDGDSLMVKLLNVKYMCPEGHIYYRTIVEDEAYLDTNVTQIGCMINCTKCLEEFKSTIKKWTEMLS